MEKRVIIEFIIILLALITPVSSLSMTEIELNPEGSDAGNEWIEFYNEEEINLKKYFIEDNDGDTKNLSGNYSGCFIYNFNKRFLDNDVKLFLYKNNDLIQETDNLEDSENNALTWNKEGDGWILGEPTKKTCKNEKKEDNSSKKSDKNNSEEENNKEKNDENDKNKKTNYNFNSIDKEDKNKTRDNKKDKEPEVIKLSSPSDSDKESEKKNSSDPKTIKNLSSFSFQENKSKYANYGLGIVALIAISSMLIKYRKNKYKNEFRE